MPSHALAANAYAQHSASVSSPRGIEFKAFQRVTAQLSAALEDGVPLFKLAEAIHLNNRLWAILATDLLSDNNQLPKELRAQLFGLSEYARKTGLRAMTGQADPKELVEINNIIMRGLRESEAATPAARPADAADAHHAAAGA
ncbi:MAG: flagellar biosynthesis regulator FlaF [Neomegalonema sp.]|nr:flagellar biosynthesis regulator FlaF [Neomegalonema sp.]